MNSLLDLGFRYRRIVWSILIFSSLSAFSISYEKGQFHWVWTNKPQVALFLLGVGALILLVLIKIKDRQINLLKERLYQNKDEYKARIKQLTPRQKEIFQLILSGKSNKEITKELFIEHSTLKTHINHLYKTLKVKSRKELLQNQ